MSMRAQSSPIPWLTFFFALLGVMWCGYIAFPTANPAPCATSGCALFRDSKIAGLSLWWAGGAYFFLLAILCLRGQRSLGRLLALLALLLDAILLVVMFLTAPCFDCLVVAALIGICFYTLKPSSNGWFLEEAAPSVLLPVWFGLFLGNCVVTVNEQMPAYILGNTASTEIRLYFSPSCPACRQAIVTLGPEAALYPVEEKEGDFESILRFEALLKQGLPPAEALERSLDPATPVPDISVFRQSILAVQLVRNRASVLKQGFRSLPLIQINGMPGFQDPAAIPERPLARPQPGRGEAPQSAPGPGHEPEAGAAAEPQSPPEGIWREPSISPHAPYSPQRTESIPYTNNRGAASEEVPEFLHNPGNLGQCGGNSPTPCE